ncbi:alpha/beta hydrolase [Evansella sp. AB-P1]|uniref:alpha/beta fold hydrolase n=1 Tax=Evansella sp. AB-P1 TaxID=3037653 RepID=UPI00325ABDB1
MELKKVQLKNGETIAYRERPGKTDPIVFIHGNMTSSKHWDLVFEEMDEKYHLLAVDLRGFGESSYNTRFDSLDELTEDVREWMELIGIVAAQGGNGSISEEGLDGADGGVHVVGWSTGGGVAMKLAAFYPEYVKSLTLLSSLSTRGYPHLSLGESGEPIRRSETKEEVEQDQWRTIPITKAYEEEDGEFLRGVWNQLIYTDNQPDEARYEAYIKDMCTQRNLADIYHANNYFNISNHDGLAKGTGEVDKITAPVLILEGELDQVVTHQMINEIRADFGDRAQYHLLKGCGHSALVDDLPQLLDVLSTFIDQHRTK